MIDNTIKTFTKNKRNVPFDLMKLFYSFLIVFLHIPNPHSCSYYACCEGFFIISGIYLMRDATSPRCNSIMYFFKKYISMLPYLLIASIFYFSTTLVISALDNQLISQLPNNFLQLFWFIFPFRMEGSLFLLWYIAALLWGSIIVYTFAKKFPNSFPIWSILISIILYIVIFTMSSTSLDVSSSKLANIIPWGYFRSIAGLCVGCSIWKLINIIFLKKQKQFFKKRKPLIVVSITMILLCLGAFACIGYLKIRTKFDILLIILVTVASFFALFANELIIIKNEKIIKFSKYVADISFILYLTHPNWITIFYRMKLPLNFCYMFSYICSIAFSIILTFIIRYISKLISMIKHLWNNNQPIV